MNKAKKKDLILKYEGLLSRIYRFFGRNRICVTNGNMLSLGHAFMRRCCITICGHGNVVEIESRLTRLNASIISITGNNCHIVIDGGSNLNHCNLIIENDNGSITLKRHVTISGHTELAVIEGTNITIGEDCLFSGNIMFRTGDSHSILDQKSGKRINPSEDITIGDHVWIGNSVKILKGVTIGDHSIVGIGAILSRGDYPSHSIIGGIGHGKILKTGIAWTPQRISFKE